MGQVHALFSHSPTPWPGFLEVRNSVARASPRRGAVLNLLSALVHKRPPPFLRLPPFRRFRRAASAPPDRSAGVAKPAQAVRTRAIDPEPAPRLTTIIEFALLPFR